MIVQVFQNLGADVLAGAVDGQSAKTQILEPLLRVPPDPLVVLDFAGVTVATASFLREFVFGLRASLRLERPASQVVVANMTTKVEEELRVIVRDLGTAIAVCRWSRKGPEAPRVVGAIEPAQAKALAAVVRLGEADASALQRAEPADPAGTTAWNNRLSGLSEKGLVIEERIDRRKVFRPVLGGLSFGS